ncbi:hypothetical protein DERF_004699 [Dermatophagoides farinae]|uniref:Uncharacterized protein n=1 Tax=Dermatophagoides farinae TaxID=6954 RepID=A0A922L7Z4_DERFA|nr:hypothetical protein DERF_004699 [Dermatophagoides farinae]
MSLSVTGYAFTLCKCLHCVLALGINLAFNATKLSRAFILIFSTNITIYSSSSKVEAAYKETHSVYGACSNKYITPAGNKVVYRRFGTFKLGYVLCSSTATSDMTSSLADAISPQMGCVKLQSQ